MHDAYESELHGWFHSKCKQTVQWITICRLIFHPVSYTHLDVYKRQTSSLAHCNVCASPTKFV